VSPSKAATNSTTRSMPSSSSVKTPAFWERLWHTSGIQFAVLLEKAAEAYARMISGNAQFRVVLTM